jgi:hypothetical protein
MLYNTSEFLTLLKEDMGIKDLPMPVDDQALIARLANSALKEFSVRAPVMTTCYMNDHQRVEQNQFSQTRSLLYKIPKDVYVGTQIVGVYRVDISRPQGYSDVYVPQALWAAPDAIISAMADIKIAAATASAMGKAMTFRWEPPDKIRLFNGWSSGVYEVDVGLVHDISLSTISPTAFPQLRELCQYDLETFLYNKMSRMDNLETGVGTINLNIGKWEGAEQRFKDLLKQWDQDGAILDLASITYF